MSQVTQVHGDPSRRLISGREWQKQHQAKQLVVDGGMAQRNWICDSRVIAQSPKESVSSKQHHMRKGQKVLGINSSCACKLLNHVFSQPQDKRSQVGQPCLNAGARNCNLEPQTTRNKQFPKQLFGLNEIFTTIMWLCPKGVYCKMAMLCSTRIVRRNMRRLDADC